MLIYITSCQNYSNKKRRVSSFFPDFLNLNNFFLLLTRGLRFFFFPCCIFIFFPFFYFALYLPYSFFSPLSFHSVIYLSPKLILLSSVPHSISKSCFPPLVYLSSFFSQYRVLQLFTYRRTNGES